MSVLVSFVSTWWDGSLVVNQAGESGLDPAQTEAVLFGEKGVAAAYKSAGKEATYGKIVVDMSSISPIATKAFAAKIQAKSCEYLDAPVSGGQVGAINATLSIMVGGTAASF